MQSLVYILINNYQYAKLDRMIALYLLVHVTVVKDKVRSNDHIVVFQCRF